MAVALKLKPSRCAWRGCDVSIWEPFGPREPAGRDFERGNCYLHGAWVACRAHEHGHYGDGKYGFCPKCYLESQEGQDDAEAVRRNAEIDRPVQDAIAQFRSQGYSPEASDSLARKKVREEQVPQRRWSGRSIAQQTSLLILQRPARGAPGSSATMTVRCRDAWDRASRVKRASPAIQPHSGLRAAQMASSDCRLSGSLEEISWHGFREAMLVDQGLMTEIGGGDC
jgi:hypothetical protein